MIVCILRDFSFRFEYERCITLALLKMRNFLTFPGIYGAKCFHISINPRAFFCLKSCSRYYIYELYN